MKKILRSFFLFACALRFACALCAAEYRYPIQNPFAATIIGDLSVPRSGAGAKVPVKTYRLKPVDAARIPKNLWFHKDFAFSLAARKEAAPLIFLLAGTGSSYDNPKMIQFQKILYEAGFHVISITSPFHANFIVAASAAGLPGLLPRDGKDLYAAMTRAYDMVRQKIDVTDFYVTGFSLGATEAAVVSYIDESEGKFGFKGVYMINPAVDLYDSADILDSYLGPGNEAEYRINLMIETIRAMAPQFLSDEYRSGSLTAEAVYALFEKLKLSDAEMAALIGFVFRIYSIDLNYIADVLTKSGTYGKKPAEKHEKMLPYFRRIGFASYLDYLHKILIPAAKKRYGLTEAQVRRELSLAVIGDYLKKANKIVAVTNADELILTKENHRWLKETFGKRLTVFPTGGHCGNMFYEDNLALMLGFLRKGAFKGKIYPVPPKGTTQALASLAPTPPDESDSAMFPEENASFRPGHVIDVYDPLEGLNRRIYYFNYGLDKYLLLPVVKTYEFIVPGPLKKGVSNFFNNKKMLSVAGNSVLQGKFKKALRAAGRFSINATWGLGGTLDTASKLGMPVPYEDFGLTLHHYGVKRGPYLVLPFLGPSTLRDGVGTGVDFAMRYILDPYAGIGLVDSDSKVATLLQAVDTRKRNSFRYYSLGSPFEYEYVRYLVVTYRKIREDISKPGKNKRS